MLRKFFRGIVDRRSDSLGFGHTLVITKHMGRREPNHWEQQTLVIAMKSLGISQAHGAHRIAVVGLRQSSNPDSLRVVFKLPVLHRHFHSDFHGSGAAIGIKDSLQPLGCDLN